MCLVPPVNMEDVEIPSAWWQIKVKMIVLIAGIHCAFSVSGAAGAGLLKRLGSSLEEKYFYFYFSHLQLNPCTLN